MGSVQARQQALAGSRSTLTQGSAHLLGTAAGPPDAAARATPPTSEGSGKDERIPVVFTWNHGGQNVQLAASFNGWAKQIPMVRSGNEFHVVQELPRGIHQYKFIVDDQWRFSPDQPKTQDADGNMNNILDILHYQRWKLDEEPNREEVPQQRFSQHIPTLDDYTLDPPQIPMVLSKSVLCAVPARSSMPPLSIPTHAICDHVYVHDHAEGGAEFGLAKVAVTHRFGNSYSTNVFVTRSPFDGCGFSSSPGPRKANFLKKAVRACA